MSSDDECQLCRPMDYRGDEINEPEGIETMPRVDGGIKTIHCCERCASELWGDKSNWTPYDNIACDGGREQHAVDADHEVPDCPECSGALGHDFPFGVLKCLDCGREWTAEDGIEFYDLSEEDL